MIFFYSSPKLLNYTRTALSSGSGRRDSEMTLIFIIIKSVLLSLFFKGERMFADLQRGRRIAMINLYKLIMDSRHNPLSHIPDNNTRHLVMQVLA